MGIAKRKRKKPQRGQKSIFYQAEVWVSNVRIASQTFETRAAAVVWHDTTKRRYEQGRGPMGEMTLRDVIARYREKDYVALVASTKKRWRRLLGLIEDSPVAKVQMANFNAGTVSLLVDWLLKQPTAKEPTRTSFTKELKMVSALSSFYREEYDETFVAPVTKKHLRAGRFKPVQAKRKDFFLSAEDLAKWFEALRKHRDPVYHAIAVFQVVMGARIGEAAGLCWDAVELDRGVLEIRRTMDWQVGEIKKTEVADRTKTESSRRTLPVPPMIADLLMAANARFPDSAEKDPKDRVVFLNRFGRLTDDNTIRLAYTKAFEAVGLPWTGSHICRYTNGTLGLPGSSTEAVMVSLGHTSTTQTLHYAKARAVVANPVPGLIAALINRVEDRVIESDGGEISLH